VRVLLIHNYYQYRGGEETYVESLKKLLEENHHEVYFYSKHSNDIKTPWDKIKIAIGLFWNNQIDRELTKIIHDFKPDVAHLNNIYPLIGPSAITTLHNNKIPIIQTIHNYRFMCPKGILFRKGKMCELCIHLKLPFWSIVFGCYHQSRIASLFFSLAYFFHRSLLHTFDKINMFIFPSQFTKKYYQKHLGIPESKTAYLPYFVDIKPPARPVKKGDYYLFVGRLSEEKGIIELLEIFKNLPEKKLKVIGTGPLQKQVEVYKKYKNIEILGFMKRSNIQPILQRARALIVPSLWYETGPINAIEALVSNTPVIGSGIGSTQELSTTLNTIQNIFEERKEKDMVLFKKIDKHKYYPIYHFHLLANLYASTIKKAILFNK